MLRSGVTEAEMGASVSRVSFEETEKLMPSSRFVVVVGIDFSEQSDRALKRAFELAFDQRATEIHAVHVAQSFESGVELELPAIGLGRVSLAEAREQLKAYVEQRLTDFVERADPRRAQAIERVVAHVRLDAPAEQIAELARELEAELVIVGTHGRKGLSRMVMGSVAEAVVRRAPCSVLVVREG